MLAGRGLGRMAYRYALLSLPPMKASVRRKPSGVQHDQVHGVPPMGRSQDSYTAKIKSVERVISRHRSLVVAWESRILLEFL